MVLDSGVFYCLSSRYFAIRSCAETSFGGTRSRILPTHQILFLSKMNVSSDRIGPFGYCFDVFYIFKIRILDNTKIVFFMF